jgi:UTP--glucose-1-phosphate uridylyltransferase
MTKREAAELFGGKHADLARALEMTRGGISQWPDELTDAQADRVIGAAIRLGRIPPIRRQRRVRVAA